MMLPAMTPAWLLDLECEGEGDAVGGTLVEDAVADVDVEDGARRGGRRARGTKNCARTIFGAV